jgi:hypothetical protein
MCLTLHAQIYKLFNPNMNALKLKKYHWYQYIYLVWLDYLVGNIALQRASNDHALLWATSCVVFYVQVT